MNKDFNSRQHVAGGRALVVGGGGATGNAWLIGVLAGLFDAGLDVTTPNLTVGTSAGSTVAAQFPGAIPIELFAAITAVAPQHQTQPVRSDRGHAPNPSVENHLERTNKIISEAQNVADMRRRLGASALDLDASSDSTIQTQWRTTVASRLSRQDWAQTRVLITAVNAHTGEPVIFDRDSGVALADAVAASCAGGFAYRIGDNQYIDGGYRSNADNADLAAGYARVLVLSPFSGRSRTPMEWGMHLETQVDKLRADGSRVEAIFPNIQDEHMFGINAMDVSMRPHAAQAGYDQGKALADKLSEFWAEDLSIESYMATRD